jgi:hypothetical protein
MRQMWLPAAAVDEYRWTTKYLRSNQRLQEVRCIDVPVP